MRRGIALLATLCCACTLVAHVGGECPRADPRCDVSAVAPAAVATSPGLVAPEPGPSELVTPVRVSIVQAGAEVQSVELGCAQRCGVVTAIAAGGVEPYTYVWSDGETVATRELCPAEVTSYLVTVSDATTSGAGERAVTSIASAAVTVRPSHCPARDPDSGVAVEPLPTDPDTGPLSNCTTVPFREPQRTPVAGGCTPPVWVRLEREIHANRRHELRAFGRGLFVGRWRIELWGSADGCARSESLGEFLVGQGQVDARVEFEPREDHATILLNVVQEVDSQGRVPYLGYAVCD